MLEVIRLFKEIQNTNSLNDKKAIITANKDNWLFKDCLKFLLDGNVITGISDKKISKEINGQTEIWNVKDFKELMKYLKKNNTGRDEDIGTVQWFLERQPKEHREFYSQMVTKSFRLGADAKLINKCIPNLIPVFDVQLGTSIEKTKLNGDEKIFISRKLNGTRCAFIGNKCMTRQGKEYKGLDHIVADLQKLVGTDTFVDGELVYKNKEGLSDSAAFQIGTGLAMSKSDDKSDLKLVIFDIFPLSEFWSGKSKETYSQRHKRLKDLQVEIVMEELEENLEVVEMFYDGYDHSEIWKWLDYAEEHDYEGCIVNLDACYECKRTKNLLKVKRFYTYDLEVVGVEEGTGANAGKLGAIVVEFPAPDGNTYNVSVGSGFLLEEREKYWAQPYLIVDKIVEVQYFEVSQNQQGGYSLRFPVFKWVREDKDEVSVY